ncbi:MAG TPA: ImmA/IrrE family metallo-endopeptidase [Candidatus Sulfotelmatobacter sp.]|nr:ImmA/IrrE family metallo-endopeptidase [Candidatus Sulfotelmatobacter sp.]
MKIRQDIERLVASLLEKHSVTEAPVPVERLANAEGLPIIQTAYDGDVSGALIRANGLVGIAVNATHHPNRRRFTVAHELAHFKLQHEGEHVDRDFTIIRRDNKSSEANVSFEIEANAYAACLLMPREFLLRDLRVNFNGDFDFSDEHLATVAKKYRVSPSALRYRLINLGLVSPV